MCLFAFVLKWSQIRGSTNQVVLGRIHFHLLHHVLASSDDARISSTEVRLGAGYVFFILSFVCNIVSFVLMLVLKGNTEEQMEGANGGAVPKSAPTIVVASGAGELRRA